MIPIKIVQLTLLFLLCTSPSFLSAKEAKVEEPQGENNIYDHSIPPSYGAEAAFFIQSNDLKYNLRDYSPIKMGIKKIDQFTYAELYKNQLQNLGSNGSATQPIFCKLPQAIGATSGFNAYNVYFHDYSTIKYYHTPTAYSNFYIVLANMHNFVFDACYSRNINKNWIFGGNLYHLMAENEWPSLEKDYKIVGDFPSFNLFTHFKTANTRYHIFANFSSKKHRTHETGGIRNGNYEIQSFFKNSPWDSYLALEGLLEGQYMDNPLSLEEEGERVTNKDQRKQCHIYQQFLCNTQLQLYHELIYNRQINSFKIKKTSGKQLEFLGGKQVKGNKGIKDRMQVTHLSNELGVKGDMQQFFYSLYYRHIPVYLKHQNRNRQENEHYIGTHVRYYLAQKKGHFYGHGEYLFDTPSAGYYKADIGYRGDKGAFFYKAIQYKPSFLVTRYQNEFRTWRHYTTKNKFTPPTAQEIGWQIKIKFPYVSLKPGISLTRVQNHIYFDSQAPKDNKSKRGLMYNNCITEPRQCAKNSNIASLYGDINLTFFIYFHLDNHVILTKSDSIFTLKVPSILYNGRLYYAANHFHKKLDIETGFNFHFKDVYFAPAYDPVVQQFYTQNIFPVHGRFVLDVFVNFRIKNLRIFWRISNLNEFWQGPMDKKQHRDKKIKGYFVTPFYPGQKQAWDLALNWSFFD